MGIAIDDTIATAQNNKLEFGRYLFKNLLPQSIAQSRVCASEENRWDPGISDSSWELCQQAVSLRGAQDDI